MRRKVVSLSMVLVKIYRNKTAYYEMPKSPLALVASSDLSL